MGQEEHLARRLARRRESAQRGSAVSRTGQTHESRNSRARFTEETMLYPASARVDD